MSLLVANIASSRAAGFSSFFEFAQENGGMIAYLVSQNIDAVHNTVQEGGNNPKALLA